MESPRHGEAWSIEAHMHEGTSDDAGTKGYAWSLDGDTLLADDPFEVGMMLESAVLEDEVLDIRGTVEDIVEERRVDV